MINARDELLEHLQSVGKTLEDITYAVFKVLEPHKTDETRLFVHHKNSNLLFGLIGWLKFEYDNGLGCQYLFGTVIYTDGSWSVRSESDGSEGWVYLRKPTPEQALLAAIEGRNS